MTGGISIIVFSDLDGTLLDDTRSSSAARDALGVLGRERIPIVFCSGKTRAEIQLLQREFGIRHPFVCENGGALYIPDGYFGFEVRGARPSAGYQIIEYGRPYAEVVDTLHRVSARLQIPIVGFSDMSVEDVARECRLSLLCARLAKLREYDEPFRVVDADPTVRLRLSRALRAAALAVTPGHLFDHAAAPVDKGLAVGLLAALYARAGSVPLTVGLGDTSNDASFLRKMDIPVVVHNGDLAMAGRVLELVPSATLTRLPGSTGWAGAITQIVEDVRAGRADRLKYQGL